MWLRYANASNFHFTSSNHLCTEMEKVEIKLDRELLSMGSQYYFDRNLFTVRWCKDLSLSA